MDYPHFSRQVLNTSEISQTGVHLSAPPFHALFFKCCLHIGFRACLRHPQPTWTADESFSFLLCVPMIRTQWRIGMGSRYLQPKFFKRHGSLRPNAAWCICAFNKVCCNELKCGMPFRHQNAQNTTILMIHYTMIDGELQEFWLKGVCKSVTNH